MGGNESLFGYKLLGEVGGRRDEPKPDQKIVIRSRVLCNNYLQTRFFSHSPKFFRPPLSEIDLPVPNQTLFLTYFWYIFKTVLIVFENFIKNRYQILF